MDCSLLEPTLYTVKGMAILDNDGNRILAKYYDDNIFPTIKEQKAFEKNLFNRTHRANAEIIMLDGITCLYRSNVDLFFYVMGSSHENEILEVLELKLYTTVLRQDTKIATYFYQNKNFDFLRYRQNYRNQCNLIVHLLLMSVLQCMYDSISQILRKNVEKRVVLDNLDVVMLALDEICDNGIILEADSGAVVQRVALRTDDIPIGEQTVAQVFQSAREQLKWSLLK